MTSVNPQATPAELADTPLMLDRRAQIADLVRQAGVVRVQDLAERFQVSTVTIRSDLAQLERDGVIIRDRGGAVARRGLEQTTIRTLLGFEQRTVLFQAEKRRIGQAAARLVAPGDSIIMDAGTTVVEMVPYLQQTSPLIVATNGLNIAAALHTHPDARVLLLGGSVNYRSFSTLGPQVEQSLSDLVVQKLFLGTQAVDLSAGLTDTTPEIAQVKRAMVRAARQVILLADSGKWGRTGFLKVVPLDAVHTVVSDSGMPDETRSMIKRLGIQLILV